MTKETGFYVAIFSATALAVGWYFRGFRGASNETRETYKKYERFRNARNRLAGIVTFFAVLFAAVLYVVAISGHHHK